MKMSFCPVRSSFEFRLLMRLLPSLAACLAMQVGLAWAADPAGRPAPGDRWTSPASGMVLVWIAPLEMWVGQFEVTNGEFRRFRPTHDSGQFNGHSLNGDRQPAVEVGFDDAVAFAEWLNEQEAGLLGEMRYRLPSQAEWLAYARCGDQRTYPWGNEMPPAYGNYHGEEGAESWDKIADFDDGQPVTCLVEESGKNDWRLYGVGGNVWEATLEAMKPDSFSAWHGASWADGVAYTLRIATQDDGSPSASHVNGFRLVLAPEGRPALAKEDSPVQEASNPDPQHSPHRDEDMLQYTIQDGDTWQGIARLFVVSRESLLRVNQYNGFEEPTPGTRILIPPI